MPYKYGKRKLITWVLKINEKEVNISTVENSSEVLARWFV